MFKQVNGLFDKKRAVFLITVLFNTFLVFFLVSLYFGYNPINYQSKNKIYATTIIPEGWAFFTRNSKEPLVHIVSVDTANNVLQPVDLRNGTVANFFGFRRLNRVVGIESLTLLFEAKKHSSATVYQKQALNLSGVLNTISADTLRYDTITVEKKRVPHIKGKVLLVLQERLPWALLNADRNYKSRFFIFPLIVQ